MSPGTTSPRTANKSDDGNLLLEVCRIDGVRREGLDSINFAFRNGACLRNRGTANMQWDEQTLVALGCVAIAAVALARRAVRWWRGQTSAGGCSGCAGQCQPGTLRQTLDVKLPLPVVEHDPVTGNHGGRQTH